MSLWQQRISPSGQNRTLQMEISC